jgi:hypothetical protein
LSNDASNGNKANGIWFVLLFIVGIIVFIQALTGGGSSSSSVPSSVDRGSFEHRYATERFKQEGYSATESQQAADAVIKFHNAQQNRKK